MFRRIYYDFILLDLNEYSNIGVSFKINIFLFALFLALGVGFFVADIYRGSMALMIKQLFRHKAQGESNAVTLKQLGLDEKRVLKRMLSADNRLTRMVLRVGQKKYTYEEFLALKKDKKKEEAEKIDFDEALFYISEDCAEKAKRVQERYNGSFVKNILYCVLLLALYVCLMFAMPEILNLINDLLGRIAQQV